MQSEMIMAMDEADGKPPPSVADEEDVPDCDTPATLLQPTAVELQSPEVLPLWQREPHVLTHMPKLAQCPVCSRVKMKKKQSRRKTTDEVVCDADDDGDITGVGAIITADHIVNRHV